MLAVRPEARNLGLGRRLKEHQRHMVRELGGDGHLLDVRSARSRATPISTSIGSACGSPSTSKTCTASRTACCTAAIPTDRLIVAWPTHDDEIDERLAEAERTLAIARLPAVADRHGRVDRRRCGRGDSPALRARRDSRPTAKPSVRRIAVDEAAAWRQRARRGLQWGLAAGYTVTAFFLDEAAGPRLLSADQDRAHSHIFERSLDHVRISSELRFAKSACRSRSRSASRPASSASAASAPRAAPTPTAPTAWSRVRGRRAAELQRRDDRHRVASPSASGSRRACSAVEFAQPDDVFALLEHNFRGHNMAKAAIEMGCWDVARAAATASRSRDCSAARATASRPASRSAFRRSPEALVERARARVRRRAIARSS